MMNNTVLTFDGTKLVTRGVLPEVARVTKEWLEKTPEAAILAFEAGTGKQVELDLHGRMAAVMKRYAAVGTEPAAGPGLSDDGVAAAPGPGRPKLGVVGREVTLLPRHWEWLGTQPGGASVALRKLVESGMKAGRTADEVRQRREAAYRFLAAMAGNLPDYEEVLRALFAGDRQGMEARMKGWPKDVRAFALELAFAEGEEEKPAPEGVNR